MLTKNFAERLKKVRIDKGYSQKKISEICSIGQGFFSEVEQGHSLPSSSFILSIYKQLAVNINWLLTGEGEVYVNNDSKVSKDELSLGVRLKKCRKSLNLTQDEFGKKLSVTHGFISRIENNNNAMGAEFLYELNRQLNVNINWLLAGDGPMFLINTKCESKNTEESQPQTDAQKEINESFTPKQFEALKTIISAEISKNNRHVSDEELKLLDELKTEAYLKPMLDMIRDLSIEERKIFFDIILEQKRQSALGSNRDMEEIDKKSA
jgi:transcriptional regulator with XRE-family HTH domain